MKACRCRNLLFIQLHQVLLMINQNRPSLHGDMQNSVAVSGRFTMEFRASSGFGFFFFFSPLFVSRLFSRLTSAFCLLLLWLKMLESIQEGEGGRSMIYLEGNKTFGKFGSTHPSRRQDVLLAGAIPYLLSFIHVLLLHLYFCGFQKKERFILPSQKQVEVSIWRVSPLSGLSHEQRLHIVHLMKGCRTTGYQLRCSVQE